MLLTGMRLREINAFNNKRVKVFPIDFSEKKFSDGVIKEIDQMLII